MMVLLSTEIHSITLKILTLFRSKLRDSKSTSQIVTFANYYGDCKYDGTFDSIEEQITFPRDSRFESVIPS